MFEKKCHEIKPKGEFDVSINIIKTKTYSTTIIYSTYFYSPNKTKIKPQFSF